MANDTRIIIECEKIKNLHSGLGQFCFHLGNELAKLQMENLCFYVPKKSLGVFGSGVDYMRQRAVHKLMGVQVQAHDVFHATHQTGKYFPATSRPAMILTVHDLNFLYKYEGTKKDRKLKELQQKVNRATVLTAISKFVANELEEYIDTKNKKVEVIYNGVSIDAALIPQKPVWMNEQPFLFTLGIILPRKNFHVLLPLMQQQKDLKLVIAGNNESGYATQIKERAAALGIADRIILPGGISENEKIWLYKNCRAFVFPSLAEGFGLPVIEAMSLGTPVFLNRATCLPEIGGEHAFYWDSFDPLYMNNVYEKGISRFHAEKLSEKYILHASRFSWSNAALQYAAVYNSLL